MRRPKTRQWNFSTLYGGSTLLTTMWIHLTVSSQTSHLGRLPADMTLRETYEDEHISCFDLFIEWNALCRISHSGLDGETYRTMIAREFEARGIKERLQIYRKIPSAADSSEITSSWSSLTARCSRRLYFVLMRLSINPFASGFGRLIGKLITMFLTWALYVSSLLQERYHFSQNRKQSCLSARLFQLMNMIEMSPPTSTKKLLFLIAIMTTMTSLSETTVTTIQSSIL